MKTAKTLVEATKGEKNLNNRVEKARSWDQFRASIPSLRVVDHLYGKDQAGLAIQLDTKHKVAVHQFPDGIMRTVPVLRSDSYHELAHDHVYDTIHKVLEGAALGHKVLTSYFTHSSGELHTDIVLDKAYKMDEEAWEKKSDVHYTDNDGNNIGLYRPIIRVRSSFIQSSSITMGLLRVVCSNGMVGVELDSKISEPLRFTHVAEVVNRFETGVGSLITSLFEKNLIENMMLRLNADFITCQVMIEWMLQNLGKQATVASVDQFHLTDKKSGEPVSKWVAYNMVTWAMSNLVNSVSKRDRAQRAMPALIYG